MLVVFQYINYKYLVLFSNTMSIEIDLPINTEYNYLDGTFYWNYTEMYYPDYQTFIDEYVIIYNDLYDEALAELSGDDDEEE